MRAFETVTDESRNKITAGINGLSVKTNELVDEVNRLHNRIEKINEEIGEIAKIQEYLRDNEEVAHWLTKRIKNLSEHIDTLRLWRLNPQLAYRFCANAQPTDCRCISLDDALFLAKQKPGNVIMHVSEINTYEVLPENRLYEFVLRLRGNRFEKVVLNCDFRQIVFAGSKQKVVFCYNGPENELPQLIDYVSNLFHERITIENNGLTEITINGFTNSYQDAQKVFTQMQQEITRNHIELGEQISTIPLMLNPNGDYVSYSLGNAMNNLTGRSVNDLIETLKTTSTTPITINLTINNGGNVVNNNAPAVQKSLKTVALEWIAENLPQDKENTKEYYKKYTTGRQEALTLGWFNRQVTSFGYTIERHNKNTTNWKSPR